jgi:hypothetical protein
LKPGRLPLPRRKAASSTFAESLPQNRICATLRQRSVRAHCRPQDEPALLINRQIFSTHRDVTFTRRFLPRSFKDETYVAISSLSA